MKNQRNGNGTTCTHVAWLEREARRRRNEPPDPFLRERPEENLLAAATDIVCHTQHEAYSTQRQPTYHMHHAALVE